MVKRCFVVTLFLILISMTLGVENQVARLSMDEMKNIKGGAGDPKWNCGPKNVLCGSGDPYPCYTEPWAGGVHCLTYNGYDRYFIVGCDFVGGTNDNCAYDGISEVLCTKTWTCKNDNSGFPYYRPTCPIDNVYPHNHPECRAWNNP